MIVELSKYIYPYLATILHMAIWLVLAEKFKVKFTQIKTTSCIRFTNIRPFTENRSDLVIKMINVL